MQIRMMQKLLASLIILCTLSLAAQAASTPQLARWSEKAANEWYAKQPWLVGSNDIPATAINELEMWQADSFDLQRIDMYLGWAESTGLNTICVFLNSSQMQQN